MQPAYLVYLVIIATLIAFVSGRIRYDVVALLALMVCVLLGLVPADHAFSGFGHPAVVTVAAVLVLSKGFQNSGVVDWIAAQTLRVGGGLSLQILTLTGVVGLMSGFMNNVGALALMLPVALRMARENKQSPSLYMMPLAFGSLLGGLTTLIGTPPNIIVSAYRAQEGTGEGYGMFSFAPVGFIVLFAGLFFLAFFGKWLTPERKGQSSADELFETADYLSELEVTDDSKANGWSLQELRDACKESVPIVAVIRGDKRTPGHAFHHTLRTGDLLLLEAEPEEIQLVVEKGGLKVGSQAFSEKLSEVKELRLVEAVVQSDSRLIQRSAANLRLIDRYGLHLLAVARQGGRIKERLNKIRFRAGDVLLFQGNEDEIRESLPELGCLLLASRDLNLGRPRRMVLSILVFGLAVVAMVMGWMPSAIALTCAALINILAGVVPLRDAYRAIDWPIIILLGAMIPVGESMESTGGARLIAEGLAHLSQGASPVIALALLFVITQALSNVINNAAAAVIMAPVALSLASGFNASLDPFLMVVAVSASCAFMTPIGHQSNTLVMGPGGYRFGDYWKLGLPLSGLMMVVGIAAILWIWPL